MNGPMKMYSMRQIIRHDLPIELPTCMYGMKNIHGDEASTQESKRKNGTVDVSPNHDQRPSSVELITEQNNHTMTMAMVHEKQTVILKQLEDLKAQMISIRDTLHKGNAVGSTCVMSEKKNKVNTKQPNMKNLPKEISLNANPNNPPYSLVLLQKSWKNLVNLNVIIYNHSTITELPENAQQFSNLLKKSSCNESLPTVTIRLIWKNIGINHLELTGPRPIQGEVNLLRYLARLTSSLNYDEDHEVDSLLDNCYSITRSKTKTERIPLLQKVNKKLGKKQFIFDDFSIVDLAAYSAIKQTASANEVNVGLTKWMKNCETIAAH